MGHPILIGVDGSPHSLAAVEFGIREATQTGQDVVLLSVVADLPYAGPHDVERCEAEPQWTALVELAADIAALVPEVPLHGMIRSGPPAQVIVDTASHKGMVVVGRRGFGALGRLLLGSTSRAVAATASSPVVVVPDGWPDAREPVTEVVVGLDGQHLLGRELCFAFEEARRWGAELHVVSASDNSPLSWTFELGAPAHMPAPGVGGVDAAVAALSVDFPEVKYHVHRTPGDPTTVLLDRARSAQLMIVGRRSLHLASAGLGSVARSVLQHVAIPVIVVPAGVPRNS